MNGKKKRTEERVEKWAEKHIIYPPFLKLNGEYWISLMGYLD